MDFGKLITSLLLLSSCTSCKLLSDEMYNEKIKDAQYTGMVVGYQTAEEEMLTRFQNMGLEIAPLSKMEPISKTLQEELLEDEQTLRS